MSKKALLLSPLLAAGFAPVTAGAHASGSTNPTTSAIDTTGADLIIFAFSYLTGASYTVGDSKSNSWTGLTAQAGASGSSKIYYCVSPVTDVAHTFFLTAAGVYGSIMVQPFSGCKLTLPFDQENGAAVVGASLATGSVTPSENNELMVTVVMGGAGAYPFSIDSGFSTPLQDNGGSGNFPGAFSYLIQTTAGSVNPTWSATFAQLAATIATFKAA